MKSLTKELITKSLPHAKKYKEEITKYKEEITTLRKLLHTYGVAKVRSPSKMSGIKDLRDIMTKLIKKGLTVEEIRQVFDEVVTEIVIVS